jgi:hypothetical protein
MKKIIYLAMFVAFAIITSCSGSQDDDQDNDNRQTVITNDTSILTGRLLVEVRRNSNGNFVDNAEVNLYLNYDDMLRDFPLYSLNANNGRADFGFVLNGNYYITGSFSSTTGVIRDTTVAQVLPRNTITRLLYLR